MCRGTRCATVLLYSTATRAASAVVRAPLTAAAAISPAPYPQTPLGCTSQASSRRATATWCAKVARWAKAGPAHPLSGATRKPKRAVQIRGPPADRIASAIAATASA
ncbi:Uncharacterised protein [Mycobacteroides abscessus subsp. abscessus]|nr:Uncharacterised protein [Mycobacteroides abscessus subsp. abscessus]